jgi:hypothetical protein
VWLVLWFLFLSAQLIDIFSAFELNLFCYEFVARPARGDVLGTKKGEAERSAFSESLPVLA